MVIFIVNKYVYNNFFEISNLVAVKGCMMTKEAFLKNLGKNITRLREKGGMSQTELALKLDKDRQSMNRVEKGRTNPTIYFLNEIAKELDIPLIELLTFE